MDPYLQIQILAVLVAMTTSLLGPFLILRQMSMMIDSITHTILLGIVIAFLYTQNLNSPLLIIGASLMGVLTVYLTELLQQTKLVHEDAAIGIVFPLLFSIAVILISVYAGKVHLDIDSVLLGKIEYAPFDTIWINGVNIGAKSIYVMAGIFLLNLFYIILFYKELKLSTFDYRLAFTLGFLPVVLRYSLMTLVSITTVGAFQAVGSILVIAFMVGPAATAYLLTDDLKIMIWLSGGIGALSGLIGYYVARYFDVSISGMIAVTIGAIFLITFICSPKYGLIFNEIKRQKNRQNFDELTVLFHILNHMDKGDLEQSIECNYKNIGEHLRFNPEKMEKIVEKLLNEKKIEVQKDGLILLTESGKTFIQDKYRVIFQNAA